jgi:hypothetical protein
MWIQRMVRFGACVCLLIGCQSAAVEERYEVPGVTDPATIVSSLSDTQAVDACIAMVEHYDARLGADAPSRAYCLGRAVVATDTEAECTTDRTRCDLELAGTFETRSECERGITSARTGCTATVAELERCVDDTADLIGDTLAGSCADAPAITSAEGTRYESSSPPSCRALAPACRELVLQAERRS